MQAQSVETARLKIAGVPHWYHQIEVAPGVVTPGVQDSRRVLERLGLPEDCTGLRALDIGARDGFFSFELERRGADVLALDYFPPTMTGFAVASDLLGSHVTFEVANVHGLNPERYGQFDIILFLGVLYHLRNPMLVLDKIWSVCRDQLWVESHVIDDAFLDLANGKRHLLSDLSSLLVSTPIMQFYPGDALNRDGTSWWGPNMVCLRAMLEAANFVVEEDNIEGGRGILRCRVSNDPERNYYREIEQSVFSAAGQ